jgi:hypothetical protein
VPGQVPIDYRHGLLGGPSVFHRWNPSESKPPVADDVSEGKVQCYEEREIGSPEYSMGMNLWKIMHMVKSGVFGAVGRGLIPYDGWGKRL